MLYQNNMLQHIKVVELEIRSSWHIWIPAGLEYNIICVNRNFLFSHQKNRCWEQFVFKLRNKNFNASAHYAIFNQTVSDSVSDFSYFNRSNILCTTAQSA